MDVNHDFIINFLFELTQVDRFDMAVEFWTDDEREDAKNLVDKLKKNISQAKFLRNNEMTDDMHEQMKLIDKIAEKFQI